MSRFPCAVIVAVAFVLPSAAAPLSSPASTGSSAADSQQIRGVLNHADEEGLDPGRYRPTSTETELNAALLRYIGDLHNGRPELQALDSDVSLPRPAFDPAAALAAARRNGNIVALLGGLAPPGEQYPGLKAALARYRSIAAGGGWPALPAAAPAKYTRVYAPLLRQRLATEDEALKEPRADLIDAVKRFQSSNGLAADGVIGAKTLAVLNISAEERAETILANMERWRWLPLRLESDRIVINVADQSLELWLDDRKVLGSPVVVGRPDRPTPILRAEGAGVTVNPPWNIPASIAAREILPKLKANRFYLASHDMVLVDGPAGDPQGFGIKWHAIPAGHFPYRIRQYPGPKNPLGRIKIELPNKFDVYLHDTPDTAAFARPRRDLSHGCVRVEQILPLASYALEGDVLAMDMINQAIGEGETKYLPLKRSLPVYFLYWTAFPGADGSLQFRPDIYGRDQRLILALKSQPLQLAAAAAANCAKG